MINPERKQLVEEVVEELNNEYPEYGFGYYISNGMWLVVSKGPYKKCNGWRLFRSFDEINKGYLNDMKNEVRNTFLFIKGMWQTSPLY